MGTVEPLKPPGTSNVVNAPSGLRRKPWDPPLASTYYPVIAPASLMPLGMVPLYEPASRICAGRLESRKLAFRTAHEAVITLFASR